jgi:hypothetical protein
MNHGRLISRFRVSAAMRPYVLRLRLSGLNFDCGSDANAAVAYTGCIKRMTGILARRRVSVAAANKAILATLEAAAHHQLSQIRFDHLRKMENHSLRALDQLISGLRALGSAITRLPPRTRGDLNRRMASILELGIFDTEVLIEVLEALAQSLRKASPKRLAEDAYSIIHQPLPVFKEAKPLPHLTEQRRPLFIDLWESIPDATRVKVECIMQKAGRMASLSGWLTLLADLLLQEPPACRVGGPHSQSQLFVWRVASIWRRLGLRPGLAYNHFLHPGEQDRIGRGGRIASGFQDYCRDALAAFGDSSVISARQVEIAKKRLRSKSFRMP